MGNFRRRTFVPVFVHKIRVSLHIMFGQFIHFIFTHITAQVTTKDVSIRTETGHRCKYRNREGKPWEDDKKVTRLTYYTHIIYCV